MATRDTKPQTGDFSFALAPDSSVGSGERHINVWVILGVGRRAGDGSEHAASLVCVSPRSK